jgi:hypothetical protein
MSTFAFLSASTHSLSIDDVMQETFIIPEDDCLYPANRRDCFEHLTNEIIFTAIEKKNSYSFFSLNLLNCRFNQYSDNSFIDKLKIKELLIYFHQYDYINTSTSLGKRIMKLLCDVLHIDIDDVKCSYHMLSKFNNILRIENLFDEFNHFDFLDWCKVWFNFMNKIIQNYIVYVFNLENNTFSDNKFKYVFSRYQYVNFLHNFYEEVIKITGEDSNGDSFVSNDFNEFIDKMIEHDVHFAYVPTDSKFNECIDINKALGVYTIQKANQLSFEYIFNEFIQESDDDDEDEEEEDEEEDD